MLAVVEEHPGVCTIGYDVAYAAVVITWSRNNNDLFRPMLETQLRLVVEHQAAVVVVDTTDVTGALNDANQAWLTEDYFPRLADTGLVALITVVPRSAIAVLVNRRSFRGREMSFAIHEVASLEDALALAATYKRGVAS